jgi:hypothetical protein
MPLYVMNKTASRLLQILGIVLRVLGVFFPCGWFGVTPLSRSNSFLGRGCHWSNYFRYRSDVFSSGAQPLAAYGKDRQDLNMDETPPRIDDSSHRAVFLTLAGVTQVSARVGVLSGGTAAAANGSQPVRPERKPNVVRGCSHQWPLP